MMVHCPKKLVDDASLVYAWRFCFVQELDSCRLRLLQLGP